MTRSHSGPITRVASVNVSFVGDIATAPEQTVIPRAPRGRIARLVPQNDIFPTNTPDKVGNLWLSYDIAPSWQVGGDARYVSSMYANAANTLQVKGWTRTDLGVRYLMDIGNDRLLTLDETTLRQQAEEAAARLDALNTEGRHLAQAMRPWIGAFCCGVARGVA